MVKEGSARAKKFKVKHDPDLIMLRWKALRDFSIKRFYVAATKQFLLDDNIRVLIERYVLPYGQAGTFMDLMRKFVYSWGYLTDLQKESLKQEWLSHDFPEELFDRIALKYYEMQNYITQHPTTDMVLLWFSELDPYPQEAITPKEEDLTTKIETEYDTKPLENMPYWKQEGYKEGILLRKLVTVFQGYDVTILKTETEVSQINILQGVEFTLEIPSIEITEFEQYVTIIISNPTFEIELTTPEIEKTLMFLAPLFVSGVNTSWLENLFIIPFTSSVFPAKTQTLTQPSPSATLNVFEGKTLISVIPNPSIEVIL
jgi:hypothetical protein